MAKLTKTELASKVYELSTSGCHVHNPYHNLIHCWQVYKACDNLLQLHGLDPSDELIWASIYHDYNHSGGRDFDTANIEKALVGVNEGIKQFYEQYPDHPTVDIEKIESMIRSTLYIGTFPNEPKSLEEQCLRDADLMTIFAENDIAVLLMRGLYRELTYRLPTLTIQEFINMNYKFLSDAKYYTEPARDLVEQSLMLNLERLNLQIL
jgi:hypothetical protein